MKPPFHDIIHKKQTSLFCTFISKYYAIVAPVVQGYFSVFTAWQENKEC